MTTAAERTPESQLDKFKQAARDLECDDDDQRFKDRLKKIVTKPLTPDSRSDSK